MKRILICLIVSLSAALSASLGAEIVLAGVASMEGNTPVIAKESRYTLEFQGWRPDQPVTVVLERACVFSGFIDRTVERMKLHPDSAGWLILERKADDCRGSVIVRASQGGMFSGKLRAQHAFEVR